MTKAALAVLILLSSSAFAAEAPKSPEPPKPFLTADEGRKLYELGVKTGMAQAAVQAAQAEMKPILDKLAPPKP